MQRANPLVLQMSLGKDYPCETELKQTHHPIVKLNNTFIILSSAPQ